MNGSIKDTIVDAGDSPVHERKGQEVEDRCGVQSTVQHDSGGFELEDIARQCRMTRQTILKAVEGEKKTINVPTTQCMADIAETG